MNIRSRATIRDRFILCKPASIRKRFVNCFPKHCCSNDNHYLQLYHAAGIPFHKLSGSAAVSFLEWFMKARSWATSLRKETTIRKRFVTCFPKVLPSEAGLLLASRRFYHSRLIFLKVFEITSWTNELTNARTPTPPLPPPPPKCLFPDWSFSRLPKCSLLWFLISQQW